MSSTLQDKTIRPGGLRYTYYKSGSTAKSSAKTAPPPKKHRFRVLFVLLVILIAAALFYNQATNSSKTSAATEASSSNTPKKTTPAVAAVTPTKTPAVAAAPVSTACTSNTLSQLVLVSISQQHLWACNGSTVAYDSAVVTGDEEHADTLTPPGTYHIYAKAVDRTLTGSDENGSWHDFVYYWMPFLDNQYGAYGFHDATWRPANAFGNIDINTANASNGCVELPLATAKWIYDWSSVGTTVTIQS